MKVKVPPFVHTFPAPVVLIGSGSIENPNLTTVSWFGTVSSEPPTISVSLRPERYAYELIEKSGEFTVNIPLAKDLAIIKYCGKASGRETHKFADLALTPLPCPPLRNAPMVSECLLAMACEVKQMIELGSHHMFIAEITAMYCDEDKKTFVMRPQLFPAEQVVYLDSLYWKLTEIG